MKVEQSIIDNCSLELIFMAVFRVIVVETKFEYLSANNQTTESANGINRVNGLVFCFLDSMFLAKGNGTGSA